MTEATEVSAIARSLNLAAACLAAADPGFAAQSGSGLPIANAKVSLPPGLTGEFGWRGLRRRLVPGEQSFRVE
jgi:hypothetical protein